MKYAERAYAEILCEVGSGSLGLALEGTDDHDEMGIVCEPAEYLLGLKKWETTVRRTRADGTPIPDGARSGPGDTDLTLHSLRKWMSLALNGNPTVIALLFAPTLQNPTDRGRRLRAEGPTRLLSRAALNAYSGYLLQQKERLLGIRGQQNVKRPELVEAHGFDTKYAAHALRLGLQGIELATTGRLEMPMREPEREYLRSIRRGEVKFGEVLGEIRRVEDDLNLIRLRKTSLVECVLPPKPDYDWANDFLVTAYLAAWRDHRWVVNEMALTQDARASHAIWIS